MRLDFIAHVAFMSVTRKPYNCVHSSETESAPPHAVLCGADLHQIIYAFYRKIGTHTLLFDVTRPTATPLVLYAGPGVLRTWFRSEETRGNAVDTHTVYKS